MRYLKSVPALLCAVATLPAIAQLEVTGTSTWTHGFGFPPLAERSIDLRIASSLSNGPGDFEPGEFGLTFEADRSTDLDKINDFNTDLTDYAAINGLTNLFDGYDFVVGAQNITFDETSKQISGKLVSGLQAGPGLKVDNGLTFQARLEVTNENLTERKALDFQSELFLASTSTGGSGAGFRESLFVNLARSDAGGGFVGGDQQWSQNYQANGDSNPPFGTLVSLTDFGFPLPGVYERTAEGGWDDVLFLDPGETAEIDIFVSYRSQLTNDSDELAQYDGTQSVDFVLTLGGDSINVTLAPEPGSLALLALVAPLLTRRRRA